MIQLLRKCLYIFQLKVIPQSVKNLVLCGYWNHITRSPDNMGELDKDLCLFWKRVADAQINFPTSSIITFVFLEDQLEAHIGKPHLTIKFTNLAFLSVLLWHSVINLCAACVTPVQTCLFLLLLF